MKHISQRLSAAAGVVALMILFLKPVFGFDDDRGLSPKAKQVRQIYNEQIGVREQGLNAGKQVEAYLRYVGLPKGNPWCAAFVCWVLGQAGVENPRTGWSPTLFAESRVIWSRSAGPIGDATRVQGANPPPAPSGRGIGGRRSLTRPGTADVFGIYFQEKGRIAHVGFVDEWDGNWVITVEGNTNPSGSRDGDGVYRKRRLVSTIYKVARYVPQERRAGS